jgi:hypothetical protein
MNTPSTIKQKDALAAMEQLDELLTLLGQQPDKRFIKKNPYANQAEYLPSRLHRSKTRPNIPRPLVYRNNP